jgi:hypothetical protein
MKTNLLLSTMLSFLLIACGAGGGGSGTPAPEYLPSGKYNVTSQLYTTSEIIPQQFCSASNSIILFSPLYATTAIVTESGNTTIPNGLSNLNFVMNLHNNPVASFQYGVIPDNYTINSYVGITHDGNYKFNATDQNLQTVLVPIGCAISTTFSPE